MQLSPSCIQPSPVETDTNCKLLEVSNGLLRAKHGQLLTVGSSKAPPQRTRKNRQTGSLSQPKIGIQRELPGDTKLCQDEGHFSFLSFFLYFFFLIALLLFLSLIFLSYLFFFSFVFLLYFFFFLHLSLYFSLPYFLSFFFLLFFLFINFSSSFLLYCFPFPTLCSYFTFPSVLSHSFFTPIFFFLYISFYYSSSRLSFLILFSFKVLLLFL